VIYGSLAPSPFLSGREAETVARLALESGDYEALAAVDGTYVLRKRGLRASNSARPLPAGVPHVLDKGVLGETGFG